MIKVSTRFLLVIVLAFILVASFLFYNYFINISETKLIAKKISENELYIKSKFSYVVDNQKIEEGFWYVTKDRWGTESIAFFDPNTAKDNMTKEQIDEIYNAVRSASSIENKSFYKAVPENEMPSNLQFYNSILSSSFATDSTKYFSMKQKLQGLLKSGKANKDDLIQLSYIYDFEGNYSERDIVNKKLCSDFGDKCKKDVSIEIYGDVKDNKGWAVQNAKVTVYGDDNIPAVLSNERGAYKLSLKVNEFQKLRLKVTKVGFSDAVVNVVILSNSVKKYPVDTAVITSSGDAYTFDTVNKTITGGNNKMEGDIAVVETSQSTYRIPSDVFYYKNGKQFSGQVEIYTYEFTRETVPESIMNVDTFDETRGYTGDNMETLGMPYIQFFDSKGERLYVKRSHPIKLTSKPYHMDILFEGKGIAYSEMVTERDMEFMLSFSQNSKEEYPITMDFLINNNLLKYPAWWIFDQNKGIWENIGFKLINIDGTMDTIFYTINDVI